MPPAPAEPNVPPPGERYRPGDVIDNKYQLVRPLGQGGMGTVWVAQNTVLEVSVAIKLIPLEDPAAADDVAERLLREARAAARLGHAAIVRVFDFGRSSHGDPFITMELLHGESLADALNHEGRLAAVKAVQTMLPIADALATAHAKGVIHRDVKPENVILATDEDGRSQPKLLDFGIASLQEKTKRVTEEKRLTREGSVVGTPAYMSPEQAMGKEGLDHRTDVWSFAVMLYELTTGHLPFDADNYNALLYEIIHRPPQPSTRYAAGDAALWRILEVGLKKNPDERWSSMRDFGEALALWLFDRGVREDICAASLRTAWLEAPRSGVKVELPDTQPPAREGRNSEDIAVEVPPSSASGAKSAARGGRGSRARMLLAGGFILGCFVAGALVVQYFVTRPSAETLDSAQAAVQRGVEVKPSTPKSQATEPPTETAPAADEGKKNDEAEDDEANQADAVEKTLSVDDALGEAVREPPKRKVKRRRVQGTARAPKKTSTKHSKPRDFGF